MLEENVYAMVRLTKKLKGQYEDNIVNVCEKYFYVV